MESPCPHPLDSQVPQPRWVPTCLGANIPQSSGWPSQRKLSPQDCNSLDRRRGWEEGALITEHAPSLEPRVKFLKCWMHIFLGRRPRVLIWLLGEISVARDCRDLREQHKTLPLHQRPHNKPVKTKN